MTEAAGAVELSQATMNINLQHDYIDEKLETLWARGVWSIATPLKGRWFHSDIKDVAYPFTKAIYQDILLKGNLR